VILPGSTVGILGGGQLGRMLAVPARQLGYGVAVLAPLGDAPALGLADHAIRASFDDLDAARRLASLADVVTYEFENVPAATARAVAERAPLRPNATLLELTQDRNREHAFLDSLGIPTAPGCPVHSTEELDAAVARFDFPCRLKSARGGYDGGGQLRIVDAAALEAARPLAGSQPGGWRLEAEVAFERELSVVVARSLAGEVVAWAPFENEHRGGILHLTRWPATGSPRVLARAEEIARTIAVAGDLLGVMCVELFVGDDEVRVNELAPRVHNSGHLTIEAAATSQFEQHLRAVCGLPLGSPAPRAGGAAMINLLGRADQRRVRLAGTAEALALGAHVHLYGKDRERPGRKMGHLTVLADTPEEAVRRVVQAASAVQLVSA
jgi:5-(carboxyamino)imidazole ribonucleotide synthase